MDNNKKEHLPPTKLFHPEGRPLKFKITEPTLIADPNQTFSNLLNEVNKTKKAVNLTGTKLDQNTKAIQNLAATATPAPIRLAPYQSLTTYGNNAQVTYQGNIYQVITTALGVLPTNTATWTLIGPATLDNLADGIVYPRVLGTALTNNNIDLSKVGVLAKGGTPPAISGSFTYTTTTTTITISWPSSMAVYRADGTITEIGAGSQTITGLTANTQYNFYPVYDELTQTLRFISESDCNFPAFTGVVPNGSTGYISTTTSESNPGSFTAEVWASATTNNQPLMCLAAPQTIGTTGNKAFTMYVSSTFGFTCYLDLTGGITGWLGTGSTSVTDGNLHHFVFTWDNVNKIATHYIDGVQVHQATAGSAQASLSGMWWFVGVDAGKTGWPFTSTIYGNGATFISNAAIYNGTILSAAQVSAHYSVASNQSEAAYDAAVIGDGASYLWKLAETAGTTAADSAGSNTGTYQGTVTLNQSKDVFSGIAGSPSIAFTQNKFLAVQQQNLQSRIALSSGPVQITTPSSGTGSGAGGGKVPPGSASMN